MKIKLNKIDRKIIQQRINNNDYQNLMPMIIQYADFNVINYLYNNNFDEREISKFYLYPDSTAVNLWLRIFKNDYKNKIVSTDFQNEILTDLNEHSKSVYLFGDADSVLRKVSVFLNNKFPNIKIKGKTSGYSYDNELLINDINSGDVDIVFVGLGAGRQEQWILENYTKLNAKIVLSVGGWFQYLSKEKQRAPILFRKFNLEWLFKLLNEFSRVWQRYLIGAPVFFKRIITKKIILIID